MNKRFINFLDNLINNIDTDSKPLNKEVETMKYKGIEVKRRKNGDWYARFKLAPCQYKDIYGKTQQECYDKLKAFANSYKEPNKKAKPKPKTFGEFYKEWLEKEKEPNCKESTLRQIESKHKNYLYKLDNMVLEKITANDLRDLLFEIKDNSVKHRCQIILKDIFNQAVNYDYINTSPMLKISRISDKTKPREAFEKEEEIRFVKKAKESPCALIFFLMLYEGLRTSEAKAICPADIKDDYILVNKSIDDYGNFISTKTNNTRKVPIFSEFKTLADKYRGDSKTPCLGKVNKHTAVKEYQEICKELGITKNMYCLRHTFATRCEEAGISVKQTAKWMGHSNIKTTLENYVSISDNFEKINIERKNQL